MKRDLYNFKVKIEKTLSKAELRPKNIFCLGCAIKVNLRNTVLPALEKVRKKLAKTKVTLELGNDCYIFETGKKIKLNREIYKISSAYGTGILNKEKNKAAHGAVVLASYTESVSQNEIVESLMPFCLTASKNKKPFCLGKGHTIQASRVPEQNFLLADYLTSPKGNYYGVANNDTIATIDFNLKHSNWLNLYASFNNALNDLFALGVYKDITIYPTYDSVYEKDNEMIRALFGRYLRLFKDYNYNIVDLGPIGMQLDLIGATVVGVSKNELPSVRGLIPGQALIVCRPIGDLASLVLYIIKNTAGQVTPGIKRLKTDILNYISTPNIEIAKIIAKYLPLKGEALDFKRHITATKDITGEGLSAFEVLALNSSVDIYVERIFLHSLESAGLNVPNNTSNTNGAIIIAAHKRISADILNNLKKIGCNAWIAGYVGQKNKTPRILLKKTLKKLPFIRHRTNLLFNHYKFV